MSLIGKIKEMIAFAESAKAIIARLEAVEKKLASYEEGFTDVDKLLDLVSKKELAASEFELFRSEELKTVEEIDEEMTRLGTLKQSFEASPAIGSRMIRQKNSQLTAINGRLSDLHRQRVRYGQDTVTS